MLMTDSVARDVAAKRVESESDREALLASHAAVTFYLFLQGAFGIHALPGES
jgi:hypothetical protein